MEQDADNIKKNELEEEKLRAEIELLRANTKNKRIEGDLLKFDILKKTGRK